MAAMAVACSAATTPAHTAVSNTGRRFKAAARATNRAAVPGLTRNR
nr:hypothetical protein [Actinoplanes sp. ATCC 53533]